MTEVQKIVVGIDGSESSLQALRWTLREAQLRKASVEVIHTWNVTPIVDPMGTGMFIPVDDLVAAGNGVIANAMKLVEDLVKDTKVTTRVVQGAASFTLLEASKTADLIVVGRRGHGGFIGLLIGSVAQQVAHHASCPSVIVPV